ncbi:unnamed protein product [Darwinula stevensoni]|uniref:Translationally-controlled tumor protein homolog n=1 Tax=Darwinula stevensoni TaxID=69355 RepID=A0A7R8XKS6_9CRUS|nr:unnamed protein product [Darwinula stevensoni]CAG0896039.1 unnamed protein product [Darwinula stevensoni]
MKRLVLFALSLALPLADCCQKGWYLYDKYCFYFSTSTLQRVGAEAACLAQGGAAFAQPRDDAENYFIGTHVKLAFNWMAFFNPAISTDFYTIGNLYTRFADSSSTVGATYMFPDDWRNVDCSENRAYICELTAAVCPTQYTQVLGTTKCIIVNFQTSVSYASAKSACEAQTGGTAGRLVTINDINTYNTIKKIMENKATQLNSDSPQSVEYWIGLTRADKNGAWQWSDGSAYGSFTRWYYQPGSGAKEKRSNCACLFPSRWSVVPLPDASQYILLTQKMGYVCRKYKALSAAQAVSGDEMFTDSFKIKLVDDVMYEVYGKLVMRKQGEIVLTGSNPSTEEADEGTDEAVESGVDIVLNQRLQECYAFPDKKSYTVYIKEYMKKLSDKLQETKPDEVEKFKANAQKAVKDILTKFKDLQFFTGESMDTDGMVAILEYREVDGVDTPIMLFFKHGLDEEKY